jgi:Flp pilus assembly pilin Flp
MQCPAGCGQTPVKGIYRRGVMHAARHPVRDSLMRKRIVQSLNRLTRDERGAEVIEYALIMGLIIVVCIAVITSFGTKVLARWQSVNSSM